MSGTSRSEVAVSWEIDHGNRPPKGMSTRLLQLSAAYFEQARQFGGFNEGDRQRLLAIAEGEGRSGSNPVKEGRADQNVVPGTRLVREWHGRTHVVDIMQDHVIYEGTAFASLSAVARAITGTRWSGPRFFGIVQ